MRRLDFISKAPNFSIFKEDANKTNLGGFLFMVYIIIILLLALVYFYDYVTNDKYQFNYSIVKGYKDIDQELKKMENVRLNAKVSLVKDYPYKKYEYLSEDFIIVDFGKLRQNHGVINSSSTSNDDECIITQDKNYEYNVNGAQLGVLYRCNKTDCAIRDKDKIKLTSYTLFFDYQGFSIDHQDPEKPLRLLSDDNYLSYQIQFLSNSNIIYLNWGLIEYEEEKGVFGKTFDKATGNKYKYYGGDYKSMDTFTDDGHMKDFPQNFWNITDLDGNSFIMLLCLISVSDTYEYERYTRKKLSVLDILANIASLSSTALNLMGLAYGILYSANYNNYKIIENILTKKMKVNIIKNTKNDEYLEKAKIELKGDLIEKDLIEKGINEQDGDDIIEEEGNKMKSSSINLSIPRFIDFLFHKFYAKCCGYSSRHILINSCNDIVAKYITIENILYNQMKLECLWKDYKWNNPQFQKGVKEDLILDLKEK